MSKIKSFSIGIIVLSLIVAMGLCARPLVRHLTCSYIDKMHARYAQKSNVPMEVIFVTAEKDLETLPHCVDSVRKYLQHPIAKLTLVSKRSEKTLKIADSLNIEFLDEDEVLNLSDFKSYIQSNNLSLGQLSSHDTPEWYYQQFLKLYFYKKAQSQYYFVIDADIILRKPMTLVSDEGIHYFYVGDNSGPRMASGYSTIKNILGQNQYIPNFSFIADLMCFDKDVVRRLIERVEAEHKEPFHLAAIKSEQNSDAMFAEYELYGVYANFHSDNRIISSYLPRSGMVHTRNKIKKDLRNPNFNFVPYIAYHSWLPQE